MALRRSVCAIPIGRLTNMATDCRINSILYGALLRVLFEAPWASAMVRLFRTRTCQTLALLALLTTFMIRDENFRQTFRYTIQGVALMPLFTALLTADPKTLNPEGAVEPANGVDRAVELFNLFVSPSGPYTGEVYFGSPYGAGSMISGLVLTLGAAYALFIFVETTHRRTPPPLQNERGLTRGGHDRTNRSIKYP